MNTNSNEANEVKVTVKMALCIAAMTIVGVDGEFKEEELEKLRNLIKSDENAFLGAFNFYNEHPVDVCIKVAVARLNDAQKKETYRILHDLAQVDRDFAVSEQEMLKQYAAEFGLSKDFVAAVSSSENHNYNLSLFE
jgi:uncharacterized tellurite resistance protein B-like protein